MSKTAIDEMIEYALEELLAGGAARRRSLIRRICLRWPAEPALSVCFAITSAASMIEDNFGRNGDADKVAPMVYRLAALLAADIYAVESLGQQPARAQDLLHFWRRVDGYFLEL